MIRRSIFALVVFGSLAHPVPLGAQAPAAAPAAVVPNDYTDDKSWLCRPGRKGDACDIDLTTTVVAADGTLTRETWAADPKAPVDCFYVYPTISTDPTDNSDMNADPAELNVIAQQFARFASKCRPFAPLYRQLTLAGLRKQLAGPRFAFDKGVQYDDVRDAWRSYLKRDNQGRGVVLVSHSQGLVHPHGVAAPGDRGQAGAEAAGLGVDPRRDPGSAGRQGRRRRAQGDSAVPQAWTDRLRRELLGVPLRRAAAGQHALRQGRRRRHVGFVHQPGDARRGQRAAAGLSVGHRPNDHRHHGAAKPWAAGKTIDTPFVSVPGLLTAKCASNEHATYLEVTVHGDPADPRVDDIVGDLGMRAKPLADWGLHLVDVNIAMGNLLDLVGQQTKAYLARR